MARRGSITEEQVFEAADKLTAEGREVTPTALLAIVGSGSFTTIYKYLASWEANRASASVSNTGAEMPASVQGAFAAAWRAAISEAGKEVIAIRQKADDEVETAQKQFQEALETIERLEADSELDASRIETLTNRISELEAALQRADAEKAALNATTEQLRYQVKSQESELERMHKDAESERKRNQEERAQASAAAATLQEQMNVQLASLRKELTESQSSVQELRQELDNSRRASQEDLRRANDSAEKAKNVEKVLDQVRIEKDAAVKESATLRGQLEAMRTQNSELLSKLAPRETK